MDSIQYCSPCEQEQNKPSSLGRYFIWIVLGMLMLCLFAVASVLQVPCSQSSHSEVPEALARLFADPSQVKCNEYFAEILQIPLEVAKALKTGHPKVRLEVLLAPAEYNVTHADYDRAPYFSCESGVARFPFVRVEPHLGDRFYIHARLSESLGTSSRSLEKIAGSFVISHYTKTGISLARHNEPLDMKIDFTKSQEIEFFVEGIKSNPAGFNLAILEGPRPLVTVDEINRSGGVEWAANFSLKRIQIEGRPGLPQENRKMSFVLLAVHDSGNSDWYSSISLLHCGIPSPYSSINEFASAEKSSSCGSAPHAPSN